jgi:short-subunit dehydrogenase
MGYAIARRFAREGFDIALMARNAQALARAAADLRQLGVRAQGFSADLSRPADIVRACADVRAAMGDADVMVYNASRWNAVPAMAFDPDEFNADLSLNITGALVCAQQAHPAMRARGGGSLLFTGGGLALQPHTGAGVASLTAGKAGLRALVSALHAELAGQGLRIGMVTITGSVAAGTAFDPDTIAESFWQMHTDGLAPVEIIFAGDGHRMA